MIVAPSVLSANFANLGNDIDMLNRSKAEWIHIDVMDGVFVPNISFGFPVLEAIRKRSSKICDVHLMISNPQPYLKKFAESGADHISIHQEGNLHIDSCLREIRSYGKTAGIVLNPGTPVSVIEPILDILDLVLIMSVNPGFGGQKFIETSYKKVSETKDIINKQQRKILIQVDGGVGLGNYMQLKEAGADVIVAGNAVFASEDPENTIAQLCS